MKRRAFLTTTGATVLAGCSGTNEPTPSETNETAAIGDPIDIDSNQLEWVDDAQAVSAILSNENEDYTAAMQATVQWFDEQDRYLGSDSSSIPALRPNSTWYAAITSTAPFEAERFDLSAMGYRIDDRSVSGIETQTVDVDSDSLVVTGEIENQSGRERSLYVDLSTYNKSWITHSGSVRVRNIPAETVWRFQTQIRQVSYEEPKVGNDLEVTILNQSPLPETTDGSVE